MMSRVSGDPHQENTGYRGILAAVLRGQSPRFTTNSMSGSRICGQSRDTHMCVCVCVLLHGADNMTYTSASGTVICCIYCEQVYTGPQIKLCSEPVELHYE